MRLSSTWSRSGGVLLHVTSLPTPYGIGDLGPSAYAWVDALARARQTWWQILPLGPPGEGYSPYQSCSAFAGNPALISPDLLLRDGLLSRRDLSPKRFPISEIDYQRVLPYKAALLRIAWERFRAGKAKTLQRPFDQFCSRESWWLDDFALFAVLQEMHGVADWSRWPRDLVLRKPRALNAVRAERAAEFHRHQFIQFLFFRQLKMLRDHASARGVHLLGDLPIYVSTQSADVWANPHLFLLDRHHRPTVVAGVPPDLFSRTGQRWGNALYDWHAMRKDGYRWWIRRFTAALRGASLVRIDHFRALAASWQIPAGDPTAVHGRWVKGPGAELFSAVAAELKNLPFVAEDLGLITPDVIALREQLSLPGMRVLQFAFGDNAANPHLPHNHPVNSVAYTGTHDNDTTVGWYRSLPSHTQTRVRRYLGLESNDPADVCRAMIRAAWSSVARCAIVPAQDIFALPSSARMNVPGKQVGNWQWRLAPRQLSPRSLDRLKELTELFGRVAAPGSMIE